MPRAPRTPRVARPVLAAVLAAPALLLACSAGAPAEPAAPPAPTTTPPPDPVVVCTNQLTYWADQDLNGGPGQAYDYQHRALTSEQNDALTVLEDRARAEGWTPQQLAEQAREVCVPLAAQQGKGY